jgi:XTP/dITP diphosphohydrolase
MKIVLASNNPGKLEELQALFAPLGVELIAQGALGVPESPEPHRSFVENALIKARNAAQHTGLPSIADDAGLCIDALNGLPGVDTAYYCVQFGYEKNDDNNRRAVLEQMQGQHSRRAALVSNIVAVRNPDDPEPLIASGRVVAELTQAPVGSNGFGFDPVMYIASLGKTMAQLDPAQKNAISHRGQAARQMVQLIRERWL